MSNTSQQLRRAREAKGLTFADVEKVTRIKARYLQAMEEGHWDELPGPVQARGFVKNYARFLDLDGEALAVLRELEASPAMPMTIQSRAPAPLSQNETFAQPLAPAAPPNGGSGAPQSPPAAPELFPAPPAAQPAQSALADRLGMLRWLSLDMVAGGVALVLFVVVALLAARAYVFPLISSLTAPTPTPTSTPDAHPQIAVAPTPTITPTAVFPINPNGGVRIELAALEHAWVRVTTDGMTSFEGMLTPGQSLAWEAREQLIVETGNGAAFNFVVNGRTMGPLGERDKITIRAWSPRGEVVAPPTPSPAPPTWTPEPAPTLVPTPAP